jgi:hypothetical protein
MEEYIPAIGGFIIFILSSLIVMRTKVMVSILGEVAPGWLGLTGGNRGCLWIVSKSFGLVIAIALGLTAFSIIASYLTN